MYYSKPNPQPQSQSTREYRWSNPFPSIKEPCDFQGIYINDKPIKNRNWRSSRETHRNLAQKYARATSHLLESLDQTHTIWHGWIAMPNADAADWKQFKTVFNRFIRRSKKCMALISKQHITANRRSDQFADDQHFDFLLWSKSEDLPEHVIKEQVLTWIQKSGGDRTFSSVQVVQDRQPSNLERLANYCFKFPDTKEHLTKFNKVHFLPSTRFNCTWISGNFFQRKPKVVQQVRYWNGELQERTRTLSPLDQHWQEWLATVSSPEPLRYTTHAYRTLIQDEAMLQTIIGGGL